MRGTGTSEPFIQEDVAAMAAEFGYQPRSVQWRKPLSIEEINRMAPTAEVRERKGRP
jgi:hypothetical protein